jgi:hypothetical protein
VANGTPIVLHPMIPPVHLPADVYRHTISKVRGDLLVLAGALRALTGSRAEDGDDDQAASREPKKLHDVYKETYWSLLRFCDVERPEDVVPVWTRLANCTKSEQHTILTQEFQWVCMARGLATELYTPIVTLA